MANYIVNRNAQANGDHEVHNRDVAADCLPLSSNQQALGSHYSCESAVRAARAAGYQQSNGCYYCAYSCHTS